MIPYEIHSFWAAETISTRKLFSAPLPNFLFAQKSCSEEDSVYVGIMEYTTDEGPTVKEFGVITSTCGWSDVPCLTIKTAFYNAQTYLTQVTASITLTSCIIPLLPYYPYHKKE